MPYINTNIYRLCDFMEISTKLQTTIPSNKSCSLCRASLFYLIFHRLGNYFTIPISLALLANFGGSM